MVLGDVGVSGIFGDSGAFGSKLEGVSMAALVSLVCVFYICEKRR